MPAAMLTPIQFIAKWAKASGSERANYQLFIAGLCDLIGVEQPDPAREDTRGNACVFERRVQFALGRGRDRGLFHRPRPMEATLAADSRYAAGAGACAPVE